MDASTALRESVQRYATADGGCTDALRDLNALLLPTQSAEQEHTQLTLLSALPSLLLPPPELQCQLDSWADGGSQELSNLDEWHCRVASLLELVPLLLRDPASVTSDSLLCGDYESGHAPFNKLEAVAAARTSAREQELAARAKAEGVRSACSLGARLLASCSEFAGAGECTCGKLQNSDQAKGESGEDGDEEAQEAEEEHHGLVADPLHTESLAALARTAAEAIARAARLPPHRLRAQASANVMRLLDAEVESAQARKATHELRRKAAALAHHVTSMRRPNLGKSSDAHKVLPLLLRWCEALDATARSSFLRALRHATAELPSSEIRWHGQLLSHTLRKMIVFREGCCLCHLLPSLFEAWPHITSEAAAATSGSGIATVNSRDNSEHARREAMHLELLDTIVNELLYVAPYAAARRLHLRHLRLSLVPCLGLRLAAKLGPMLSGICTILDTELAAVASAARRRQGARQRLASISSLASRQQWSSAASADAALLQSATYQEVLARRSVCDALRLMQALLREVWPRAAAHASIAARHAVAAYLRVVGASSKSLESCHSLDSCSTSGHEDVSHAGVIKERDASDADVLTAALGVLHVLQLAGGKTVCSTALDMVKCRVPPGPLEAAVADLSEGLNDASRA